MEVVSFKYTLSEIEKIVEVYLSKDRVILINSVEMYEVVADFGKMIGPD